MIEERKMEQEFWIRRAEDADVSAIVSAMETVKAGMEHPEWYVTDDTDYVRNHITRDGFIMVAERGQDFTREFAGFFMVDFPEVRRQWEPSVEESDNLGCELRLDEEQRKQVAHMDSVAVLPKFRGCHLQRRLLEAAERELEHLPYVYYLCTVHPDNRASLFTMLHRGYVIVAEKEKYQGLKRLVLYKKKEVREVVRENVLVSACLLGVCCRYNGNGVLDETVQGLMQEANLIPVCPEILGGLSTPRIPSERVGASVIAKDGTDVTMQYQKGAREVVKLAKLYHCSCAVLKERSPACGCGRIYDGTHTGTLVDGNGVAAEALLREQIPVFGESRVESCRHFLAGKLVLGMTGGVGAGKSSVLSLLKERYHAQIILADEVAKELQQPGGTVLNELVETFGASILATDGSLNRNRFAELIFHDEEALKNANNIIHPLTWKRIQGMIAESAASLIVVEAALFDEQSKRLCDHLIYVDTSEKTRIERLMKNRGYSREKCLSIMQKQADRDTFLALADEVLVNDGTPEEVTVQVDALIARIREKNDRK